VSSSSAGGAAAADGFSDVVSEVLNIFEACQVQLGEGGLV
jgi:hypothetical protein